MITGTTIVLSPLGMVGIFPNYSYCFYMDEIYVIVHILALFSFVLVYNQSTIMNDEHNLLWFISSSYEFYLCC